METATALHSAELTTNGYAYSERATIYRMGPLGWIRTEETAVTVSLKRWAQYSKAVAICGVPRGKRKPQTHVFSNAPVGILVLEGWDHPAVPGLVPNVAVQLFDDAGNDRGFGAILDAHIASPAVRVVADLRTHNPH